MSYRCEAPTAPGWPIPHPRDGGAAGGPRPTTPIPESRPPLAFLSPRDRELVLLLANGRSTAQIATAMSLSSNTARTRIRRVAGKLAVSHRYQVVDAAR